MAGERGEPRRGSMQWTAPVDAIDRGVSWPYGQRIRPYDGASSSVELCYSSFSHREYTNLKIGLRESITKGKCDRLSKPESRVNAQ